MSEQADARLKECDLVMKGGITSGVVYPSAVRVLSDSYEFRSIGGASAGAIAAAVAAAAEYGRRTGRGGFAVLDEMTEELSRPGFLMGLFQPTAGARPLSGALLKLADRGTSRMGRVTGALGAVLAAAPLVSVGAALLLGLLVASVALGASGAWGVLALILAVVTALVAAVTAVLAALLVVGARFLRGVEANGFGLCSGLREPGFTGEAFTEWLHRWVQRCAGLDPEHDPPLTFRQLLEAPGHPIDLRLITTDLSLSRPVPLPVEPRTYLFRREDMQRLFPARVLEELWASGDVPDDLEYVLGDETPAYRYLPASDLPVVVAFRMSLSFPVLISGVRLYSFRPATGHVLENWFSDGGISSNFPIHFFDSLLPGRPTFGLDFQPYPPVSADVLRTREDVHLPTSPTEQQRPRWAAVGSLGGFLRQIADAMENWRDTMQAELPGFRDRVCQIYLSADEGGMNLNMAKPTIDNLIRKGRLAGSTIASTFDERRWAQHRFTRYLTLMQQLQQGLQKVGTRFEDFGPFLSAGAPGADVYRGCHDDAWCRDAAAATGIFLGEVAGWGAPGTVDFDQSRNCAADPSRCHCEPEPAPVIRIVPNV